MQGFQDFFVAALLGLVFACVVAKFVSVAFYGGDDIDNDSKVKVVDANKVVKVVEQVNLGNAFKVRESRSKKRVKFGDDVVVRHVDHFGIGEEIKRVVFDGKEGVIVEGKNGKDEIFKCFDEQKVNGDGEILIYSEGVNKGMSDEASERGKSCESNGIANFDQDMSLEEENVIIRCDAENFEILKYDDEHRVNEDGKMIFMLEGMEDLTIEEVINEEVLTSGSVLEGLMVNEKINNEGFSSQSCMDFVSERATLDAKEDNILKILGESMERRLSDRAENDEEDRLEGLGENVQGGLSNKDEDRAMKIKNVVIDDDWEEIERTKLEKVFAEAVNYVEFGLKGKEDELAKLSSDVQMQLYGLHKIAVEGFCYQAQPMALNFFARAKWNAWQKLGSMSPEVAMEEYIELLTEHFPEWLQHFCGEIDGEKKSLESGTSRDADHKSMLQDIQPNFLQESELKLDCVSEIDDPSRGTKLEKD